MLLPVAPPRDASNALREPQKRAIKRTIMQILETWPYTNPTEESPTPRNLPLWLATGDTFYSNFFWAKLEDEVRRNLNNGKSRSDAIALKETLEVCSIFFSLCLNPSC
jgi:hypothetical protein